MSDYVKFPGVETDAEGNPTHPFMVEGHFLYWLDQKADKLWDEVSSRRAKNSFRPEGTGFEVLRILERLCEQATEVVADRKYAESRHKDLMRSRTEEQVHYCDKCTKVIKAYDPNDHTLEDWHCQCI